MPIIEHAHYHPSPDGPDEGHYTYTYDFSQPDGYYWPHIPYYEISFLTLQRETGFSRSPHLTVAPGQRFVWADRTWIIADIIQRLRSVQIIEDAWVHDVWFSFRWWMRRQLDRWYQLEQWLDDLGILDVESLPEWEPAATRVWRTFTMNPERISNRITSRRLRRELRDSILTSPRTEAIHVSDLYRAEQKLISLGELEKPQEPRISPELLDRYNPTFLAYNPPLVPMGRFVPFYSYVWSSPLMKPPEMFLRVAYDPPPAKRPNMWANPHQRHPLYGVGHAALF